MIGTNSLDKKNNTNLRFLRLKRRLNKDSIYNRFNIPITVITNVAQKRKIFPKMLSKLQQPTREHIHMSIFKQVTTTYLISYTYLLIKLIDHDVLVSIRQTISRYIQQTTARFTGYLINRVLSDLTKTKHSFLHSKID